MLFYKFGVYSFIHLMREFIQCVESVAEYLPQQPYSISKSLQNSRGEIPSALLNAFEK
jgi:hypothetical protein